MVPRIEAQPKIATRERLLAAATDLFLAHGYEATSIADICRASGVSNGSLFHHFATKEAIGIETYVRERRVYWERIVGALEARDDPLDGLEAALRAAFDFLRGDPERYHFIVDCANSSWLRRSADTDTRLNTEVLVRVGAWAAPHVAAGRLPAGHPYAMGGLLFGPINWIALALQFEDQSTDFEPILADLIRVTRRAFDERLG